MLKKSEDKQYKGQRKKIVYRETQQKNGPARIAHVEELKKRRKDKKSKTFKACMKV